MRGVTLADAKDEYLDHLAQRNLAANSRHVARSVIHALMRVNGPDLLTSRIETHHIDATLAQMNWGPKTKATNISQMKQFFKWCRARRYMRADQDPLIGGYVIRGAYKRGEDGNKLWLWRHKGEWDMLLDAAESQHPRDRAAVAMGFYLMPRIGELADIRWGDVDFIDNSVTLGRSKTNDGDRMPMVAELREELLKWKNLYEAEHGELEPRWFVIPAFGHGPRSRTSGRYGITHDTPYFPTRMASAPYELVKRALKATGKYTDDQLYWTGGHTLRRSGARGLYDNLKDQGVDNALRLVQCWLGHSSVLNTQKYIGINVDRELRNKLFAGKSMFANVGPTYPQGAAHGSESGTEVRHLRLVTSDTLERWPVREAVVGD